MFTLLFVGSVYGTRQIPGTSLLLEKTVIKIGTIHITYCTVCSHGTDQCLRKIMVSRVK
jgi:hypothetical protein